MKIPDYTNRYFLKLKIRKSQDEIRRQLEEARLLDQISARSCVDKILDAQIAQLSMIQNPSAYLIVRLEVFQAEKKYREELKKKKSKPSI